MIIMKWHVEIKEEDVVKYQALVEDSATIKSKKSLEIHPTTQKREGVQKDFFFINNEERLHMKMQSKESTLTLYQNKGKFEAVEHLKEIFSIVQEEIDSKHNTQAVRTFLAPSGIYTFPSHQFIADSAELAFYQLEGTKLPPISTLPKPFIRGSADRVVFDATTKTPAFSAEHLRARLDPNENNPLSSHDGK